MPSSFDPSPRASKRRKTTADDDSSLPFTSRVLKTVKQAVYGKQASPKLDDVLAPQDTLSIKAGHITTKRKKLAETPLRSSLQNGIGGDEVDELDGPGDLGAKSVKSASGRKLNGMGVNGGRGAVEEEEALRTPTKTKGKRKKYKGHASLDGNRDGSNNSMGPGEAGLDGGDGTLKKAYGAPNGEMSRNGEGLTSTTTKKQRKKHKGWVYLDEGVELAQNSDSGTALGAGQNYIQVNGKTPNGSSMGKGGRAGRTLIRPTAEEVEDPQRNDVHMPASRRKIDRLKKQLEIDMVLPVQQDYETSHWKDISARQDSPDELAQTREEAESEQEQEQEQVLQTPSKTKKKRPSAVPVEEDEEPPSAAEASPINATPKLSQPDINVPTGEHAEVLQRLLDDDPEALAKLKSHILLSLTGKRLLPLVNLEEEHQKVHQLVEQTVLAGEGNSMLIIGSRGSGKTTLVETVLSELSSEHQDHFHVVRLNGFIHTDDKLALREIWRQLGKEMDAENDDLSGRSNYADTLTSLLALLAHPVGEEEGDQVATAKSVVFILDEFDLFACHPRQTLLYNLFDVAQSRNAPIAVLGLTTKVNVVDSLEKRVKSRFGQRYVHLSLPKTFTAFQDICLSTLSYHPSTHDLLQPDNPDLQGLSTAWNDYTNALFETPLFQHFLQTLYTSTKSISSFLSASLLPISLMTSTTLPTPSSFTTNSLLPPDSKLSLLPSLSTLALSLLIAAARLDIILSTPLCTFAMVYHEYVSLASKSKLQSSAAGQMAVGGGARVWSKELAKGAWERLVGLELVLPATGGGRGGKGEMWRVDVGLEEVGGCLEGMSGMGVAGLGKWCREI